MKKALYAFLLVFSQTSIFAQTPPQVVKDINTGSPAGIDQTNFLIGLGSFVVFRGIDNIGVGLWQSDGTSAGTTLVKRMDIATGSVFGGYTSQYKFNNVIYYIGAPQDSINFTNTLWRTDGLPIGTYPVLQINPGGTAFSIGGSLFDPKFYRVGNYLYFLAVDSANETGPSLWRTDGTALGTIKIMRGNPGNIYAALNSDLIFDIGTRIYKTDGTVAGTVYVGDVDSTSNQELEGNGVQAGNSLYFKAKQSVSVGWELWKTDGTSTGTVLVDDLYPDFGDNGLTNIIGTAGGKIIFNGWDGGSAGTRVYESDGTAGGTSILAQIRDGALLGYVNGKMVMMADDLVHGKEPWTTDGSTAGTALLVDADPGADGSAPTITSIQSVSDGNILYMTLVDPVHSLELWKTDGTAAGTGFCYDANPGTDPGFPFELTIIDGRCYYQANNAGSSGGDELFITAGSPGGSLTYDLYPGATGSYPENFVKANNKIFFDATDAVMGNELWSMDEPNLSGITEPAIEGLNIYPNPAHNLLMLDTKGVLPQVISVYNISGQLIQEIKTPQHQFIDVSNIAAGFYFIKLQMQDGELVSKFVKQ